MIAAIIGYLAGRAKMEGREFDLCQAMQYDQGQKRFFEVTPELSKMLYIHELVCKHPIDNAEQREAFVRLLTFIEKDSEYLPLYLLPIAYSPTKDELTNAIQTAYEAAKSCTDNGKLIRDSVLTVAVLRWSIKRLGDASSYLVRLSGMQFSELMGSKDEVLAAILTGCCPTYFRDDFLDYNSSIMTAIYLSVRGKGRVDMCTSIAAALAEYNHEEANYYDIVEQLTGDYKDCPKQDFGGAEYPITDRVQYCTKDGKILKGYKRIDGYYGWYVQCHSFNLYLLGTEEKPFDKELIYWKWFEKNWNPQAVIQATNDFLAKFRFALPDNVVYYMNWYDKRISIPFNNDYCEMLSIDFKDLKIEIDTSYNSFIIAPYVLNYENKEIDLSGNKDDCTETMSEGIEIDELSVPLSSELYIDSYLAIQKYGRMTWDEEKLNEAIQYL